MSGQADVVTVVGTVTALGGRVVTESNAAPPATPYALITRVDGTPNPTFNGTGGLVRCRYQVDVFAASLLDSQTIGKAVAVAMEASALRAVTLSTQDFFESLVNQYRVSQDFSVWQ